MRRKEFAFAANSLMVYSVIAFAITGVAETGAADFEVDSLAHAASTFFADGGPGDLIRFLCALALRQQSLGAAVKILSE